MIRGHVYSANQNENIRVIATKASRIQVVLDPRVSRSQGRWVVCDPIVERQNKRHGPGKYKYRNLGDGASDQKYCPRSCDRSSGVDGNESCEVIGEEKNRFEKAI